VQLEQDGLDVTEYPEMDEPLLDGGSVQLTVTVPLRLAVAETPVGCDGAVMEG
jgi:hypothetical protein